MTRTGKIARLPREIRDELNRRLDNGEKAKHLLEWLNTHPDVRTLLTRDFEGHPMTPNNLSEWKRGGYEDWLREREGLAWAAIAAEQAEELKNQSPEIPLAERFSPLAVVALSKVIRAVQTDSMESPPARRALFQAIRILNTLRTGDQQAVRLKIDLHRCGEIQRSVSHPPPPNG